MAKPQGAICPESGDYGIYLTLTMHAGPAPRALRRACAELPALTRAIAREQGEKHLFSALAVGARAWPRLFKSPKPRALVPFRTIKDGKRIAPGTPGDLFVHIHSNRHRANLALARRFMDSVAGSARLIEEVHGFRPLGKRDLNGFVDGTENPKGADVPKAALVGREDARHAGGSYLTVQHYIHDLKKWERKSVAFQESVIGRTKKTNIELDDRHKPPTAHISRVVIEVDGEELEIVRRGLPYATTSEQGLVFLAYGRTPDNFRRMLERMMRADSRGHYDHMMNFTQAITGANYFAPSEDLLRRLG